MAFPTGEDPLQQPPQRTLLPAEFRRTLPRLLEVHGHAVQEQRTLDVAAEGRQHLASRQFVTGVAEPQSPGDGDQRVEDRVSLVAWRRLAVRTRSTRIGVSG